MIPGYEQYVYDVTKNKTSDAFNNTTRKLAAHVAHTIPNAGEFRNAMDPDDLGFKTILEPSDPDPNASQVELKKWETRYKKWDSLTNKREEASRAAYAMILAQCSDAVIDRMQTYSTWAGIQDREDVIALLELIRAAIYSGPATKMPTVSYMEAEDEVVCFKQTRRMTNSQYLEMFKGKVEVYEHLNGEPGTSAGRVTAQLVINSIIPEQATDDQISIARDQARQAYLANRFIKNCDPVRYADRVAGLKISQVEGKDPYPKTLT